MLLLRRTLVVLSAVLPLTLALGLLSGNGARPGLWLLPCLAMTALALAERQLPVLLQPAAARGWLLALAVAAGVLAVRRASYRHAAPYL